jgi:hypothetical protein
MPVDLHDRGVGVDGHRAVAGSGARRPRTGQRVLGELVELAGVAEGEGAQERADRGRRHDPVAQHAGGGPAAQQVGVVDAVATGDHGMHHGQQLGARVGRAQPVTEVDELVGGLADPQPFRQGGREQQPGAGDRVAIVEGDPEVVKGWGGVGCWHRKGALLGMRTRSSDNRILAAQRALFMLASAHHEYSIG